MYFYTDLHIHSKYARATSKNADLENMALWALKKGISVIGTGDFTHPAWFTILQEKLVPAEPGLFRLRPDIENHLPTTPESIPPRFLLQVEVSTIYKKNNAVRKIHHLIYVPDFQAAQHLIQRLARIGNLHADGRPILGLDSRNLLDITLETSPDAYLIPAHIWTPWFAVLGAHSGFDTLTECYADLTPYLFAVETGLSSDPPMNWQISQLNPYVLVSNSDAHSPPKIGREATIFHTQQDYYSILHALKTGHGYVGTIEFFPEEGKYHLDGHRTCRIRLLPEQTKEYHHHCPECGEKLTLGVLYRVQQLADQKPVPPTKAGKVVNLIPLTEILAEILQTYPNSKKVQHIYHQLLTTLGTELNILQHTPLEDFPHTLLAEAISRLRSGKIHCQAGYDGEYGTIKLFEAEELQHKIYGHTLFQELLKSPTPQPLIPQTIPKQTPKPAPTHVFKKASYLPDNHTQTFQHLDSLQEAALSIVDKPLLILAGPGSGKTHTLTYWLLALISQHNISPQRCLAITFTKRAAHEIQQRLYSLKPQHLKHTVHVHTFHSLALFFLQKYGYLLSLKPDFEIPSIAQRLQLLREKLHISEKKAQSSLSMISLAKRHHKTPSPSQNLRIYQVYQQEMGERNWLDFDDLIMLACQIIPRMPERLFHYVVVDEFQDIDSAQYQLLQNLMTHTYAVCVIGDPNQSIYGFRGADPRCFERFQNDYPQTHILQLTHNYRSTPNLISVSSQMLNIEGCQSGCKANEYPVILRVSETEHAEAEYIVHSIEHLLAGSSLFSIDSRRTSAQRQANCSFGDIAILYRTERVSVFVVEALERSGIPYYKYDHTPLLYHPGVKGLLPLIEQHKDMPLREVLGLYGERVSDFRVYQYLRALVEDCVDDRVLFLRTLGLSTVCDLWDPRAEGVSLMTLHAAKGLEFEVVFIIGMEDGIIPLFWGRRNEEQEKEEKRLLYVGMTRAKRGLFLTRALRRLWNGKTQQQKPSPFLASIEKSLYQETYFPTIKRPISPKQLDLL